SPRKTGNDCPLTARPPLGKIAPCLVRAKTDSPSPAQRWVNAGASKAKLYQPMLIRLPSFTLFLAVLLAGPVFPSRADELADKAKAIFKANQHSVVTVQLVIKSKVSIPGMGGQSNESRHDATASVIDPSGLCVLSLSATDPGGMFQEMLGGMMSDEE